MADIVKVKVKIELGSVTQEVSSEGKYQEAWEEYQDENDHEEGTEYPPITEEFIIEQYQEDVENGNVDIARIFENASVTIEKID